MPCADGRRAAAESPLSQRAGARALTGWADRFNQDQLRQLLANPPARVANWQMKLVWLVSSRMNPVFAEAEVAAIVPVLPARRTVVLMRTATPLHVTHWTDLATSFACRGSRWPLLSVHLVYEHLAVARHN